MTDKPENTILPTSTTFEIHGDTELKVETYPDGTIITRYHKKVGEPSLKNYPILKIVEEPEADDTIDRNLLMTTTPSPSITAKNEWITKPEPPKRETDQWGIEKPLKRPFIRIERRMFVTITPEMIPEDRRDLVWAWIEEQTDRNNGIFKADPVYDNPDIPNPAEKIFDWETALPGLDETICEYVEENEADMGENIADHWEVAKDEWQKSVWKDEHHERWCSCPFCRTIGQPLILAKEADALFKKYRFSSPKIEAKIRNLIKTAENLLLTADELPLRLHQLTESLLEPIVDAIADHELKEREEESGGE